MTSNDLNTYDEDDLNSAFNWGWDWGFLIGIAATLAGVCLLWIVT